MPFALRLSGGLRRLATAALASCAVLAAPAAWAQDGVVKIGYVNSERVLRESAPARTAQGKLEGEFGKREKEVAELAARLKAAADKLDKDGPTLPEAERLRRQRDLVEQDRDLTRKRREFQEDLNQRRNEELAGLVERANKIIRQIAEQEKFDIILQEAIYAGARVDITDKVIRALNAQPASGR
ncbi:MAG: OmpH family outer membrane protein [Betaproteobacteria bacterium]|nr:OmpH family outer membrane protein [Betaproteobacteria bacterium]MCC6246908.1 OmpH family outer membrane protein [Rubrivivax sp.]MCL4696650.1 OmpH family outer membrane protein [Burkholderiaceae bacterium]